MSLPERPINRRRLLATAALSAGAAALSDTLTPVPSAAAVPPQVTLPQRGIYDTATATTWTDGFLTGNGEYGAVLYGTPTLEKVIFNHHRFVLPNGSRDLMPPVNSGQLSRARDQALSGNYGAATSTFVNGWTLRWTQTYHPGYELQISTPAMTTANSYARITDFRTGEVQTRRRPTCHAGRRSRDRSPEVRLLRFRRHLRSTHGAHETLHRNRLRTSPSSRRG